MISVFLFCNKYNVDGGNPKHFEGLKQEIGDQRVMGSAISNRVVREDLSKQMTLEQSLEKK